MFSVVEELQNSALQSNISVADWVFPTLGGTSPMNTVL